MGASPEDGLRGRRFDYAQTSRRSRRDRLPELESGLGQEPAVLGLGTLAGAEEDQHVQVHADRGGLVDRAIGENRLNQEEPSPGRHGRATGIENAHRVGVVPVVNDSREEIAIGVGRDSDKEIGGDDFAAVCDAVGVQPLGCFLDYGRALHQYRL